MWLQPVCLAWLGLWVAQRALERLLGEGQVEQQLWRWGLTVRPGMVAVETNRCNEAINAIGDSAWWQDGQHEREPPRRTRCGRVQRLLDVWFVVGVAVFALLQLAMMSLLAWGVARALLQLVQADSVAGASAVASASAVVQPVVPGLNFDPSAVPRAMCALVVALAVHELGHGLAASTERVRTEKVGVFVAVVFPGAFVRIEEGLLSQLPPRAQLKVYCAGAWHNVVLALACTVLVLVMPLLLSPCFADVDGGAAGGMPLDLPSTSAFYSIVEPSSSAITALNDVDVWNSADFAAAVEALGQEARLYPKSLGDTSRELFPDSPRRPQARGFCVDLDLLGLRDELEDASASHHHRVDDFYFASARQPDAWQRGQAVAGNCFVFGAASSGSVQDSNSVLLLCGRAGTVLRAARHSLEPWERNYHSLRRHTTAGLDAGLVGAEAIHPPPRLRGHIVGVVLREEPPPPRTGVTMCQARRDCSGSGSPAREVQCLHPLVLPEELLVVVATNAEQTIVWEGPPETLLQELTPASVRVRSWLAALVQSLLPTSWARSALGQLVGLPRACRRFVSLLSQVSLSLAVLNSLPVYFLDGQHACVQFIRLWLLSAPPPPPLSPELPGRVREQLHDWNAVHMRQRRFTTTLLGTGTGLLVVNLGLGLLSVLAEAESRNQ